MQKKKSFDEEDMKQTIECGHKIETEIQRIIAIRNIYLRLKELMPDYKNEYLDAYEEIGNRFIDINNQ